MRHRPCGSFVSAYGLTHSLTQLPTSLVPSFVAAGFPPRGLPPPGVMPPGAGGFPAPPRGMPPPGLMGAGGSPGHERSWAAKAECESQGITRTQCVSSSPLPAYLCDGPVSLHVCRPATPRPPSWPGESIGAKTRHGSSHGRCGCSTRWCAAGNATAR